MIGSVEAAPGTPHKTENSCYNSLTELLTQVLSFSISIKQKRTFISCVLTAKNTVLLTLLYSPLYPVYM